MLCGVSLGEQYVLVCCAENSEYVQNIVSLADLYFKFTIRLKQKLQMESMTTR